MKQMNFAYAWNDEVILVFGVEKSSEQFIFIKWVSELTQKKKSKLHEKKAYCLKKESFT